MSPSYRIVFCISGHGFGHASRIIEVIRALVQRAQPLSIEVRTSVSGHLFANSLGTSVEVNQVECDTGMVQVDSLSIDEVASIANAKAFYATFVQRAGAEARYLRSAKVDLVIADIPPLGFAAAAAAGIPSIAIGNFTWDWIYAAYPEQSPGVVIDDIRAAQQSVFRVLRLPLSAGFDGLDKVTRMIPFIARHSQREPAEVRRWLGVDERRPLLLLSFGAYSLPELDVAQLAALREYSIATTDFPTLRDTISGAKEIVSIPERRLYGDGLRYEDLVHAADVV